MLRNTNCQLFCTCYPHITFNYDLHYAIAISQLHITELSHVYHLYSYCASTVIALVRILAVKCSTIITLSWHGSSCADGVFNVPSSALCTSIVR